MAHRNQFEVRKTSGRSGYYGVFHRETNKEVKHKLPTRDMAREWMNLFNDMSKKGEDWTYFIDQD